MALPSKTALKKKLDRLVGAWCRSKGICEAYGYHEEGSEPRPCTPQLQWCHIKSRQYLSVRWSKNNCFCLCAGHHFWFTANPDKFALFIDTCHKEKLDRLNEEFREVSPMKARDMKELFDNLKEELQ